MADKIDDLLPTAKEIQKQTAVKEAEKAEQQARAAAVARACCSAFSASLTAVCF